ncbi:ureidoglycolate lyase [Thauera sp. WH-2]|uniref:ureidoglycolate lyase n=1 Tax=Thauera sp. WH-2 TaxID=3401574 RepID=UPI003AAC9C18
MPVPSFLSLKIEPLTHEAFAPFGEVIEAGDHAERLLINGGNTERYHDLADLDAGSDGRIIVSIFRGQPRTLPFEVRMLERHPLGSQAFIPMSGRPYLVVVAPAASSPAVTELRAFLARGSQGVNYRAGVWHHPLLALDGVSDFLVIDRKGPGQNCDEVTLQPIARIADPR